MNCTIIRVELTAALTGGNAGTQDPGRLAAHLEACASCREESRTVRRLLAAITADVVFPRESEVDWDLPITCHLTRRELSAVLTAHAADGDDADNADNAASAGTLAHLSRCSACAATASAMRRTLKMVTPETVFPRENEIDWTMPLTCARTREELSTVLDARVPQWDEVLAHLGRCPSCSEVAGAIGTTLSLARAARPEEEQVDWDSFARETARLALAQDSRAIEAPTLPFRRRWLTVALPLAASLVAAVGLAWLSLQGQGGGPAAPDRPARLATNTSPATDTPPPVVAPPALDTAPDAAFAVTPASTAMLARTQVELARSNAARYLADSGTLLLGISDLAMRCEKNEGAADTIDISLERELSSRLLRRKQFMASDLQDVEVARAVRLANEIEDLLVDIASLEPCTPPQRVQEIDERVRQRQLLMRIEMISHELDRGGERA